MEKFFQVWGLVLVVCAATGGCASAPDSAAGPSSVTPLSARQLAAFSLAGEAGSEPRSSREMLGFGAPDTSVAPEFAYCQAKFGEHEAALEGCRRYAGESYRKLAPVFDRAFLDSEAVESKRLAGCVLRHDGLLGVDWLLVEDCFSRGAR